VIGEINDSSSISQIYIYWLHDVMSFVLSKLKDKAVTNPSYILTESFISNEIGPNSFYNLFSINISDFYMLFLLSTS
jgi:hypothetical protein